MEALKLTPPALPSTLNDLLTVLVSTEQSLGMDDYVIQQMLTDPTFDAAKYVEDVGKQITDLVKGKVDGYQYVLDQFAAFAGRMKERARRFQVQADAMLDLAASSENQVDRMNERLDKIMDENGFEQLPGFTYTLFRKKHHTPSCKPTVDKPGPAEMVVYGSQFVREIPIRYEWNLNPIKEAILDGKLVTDKFELVYNYKLQFKLTDKPAVADKKKGKAK